MGAGSEPELGAVTTWLARSSALGAMGVSPFHRGSLYTLLPAAESPVVSEPL